MSLGLKMRKNLDYIALDRSTLDEMPNGFISIEANLTRTGVFTYITRDMDGKIKVERQLRPPEEVFAAPTLASLHGLPYTNEHPTDFINLSNASDYLVGMAADSPRRVESPVGDGIHQGDESFVRQKIVFYGLDAISDIKSGAKKEMSLGYQYSLDETPGVYKGIVYDSIQRDIRYNHGSLVKKARGGPNCKLILDSGLEVAVDGEFIPEIEGTNMKFKFKGKEYEVTDDVHGLLTLLSDSVTTKTSEVEKLTARVDHFEAKQAENKDEKLAVEFKKAVKERVKLESIGRKILGENKEFDSMGDLEIKIAVIKNQKDGINLDGKSDDYINARFDIAVEEFKPEDPTHELGVRGVVSSKEDADDVFSLVERARKKAWERDCQAYKRSK